jgi:site-specific DNA-methyltransferase (adenine-specific)
MNPYYQDDYVTLYHGNCFTIAPSITPNTVDLLLADPPYGINHTPGPAWNGQGIHGDNQPFNPQWLLEYPRLALWGANHYAKTLPTGGWLIWNKRDRVSRNLPGSDCEMAWTNVTDQIRLFTKVWVPHTLRDEPAFHPNQKPVALMRWILTEWTQPGDLVFDPYMGSGPVARACLELKRHYIGIEIEERYCEKAAKRLAQDVLDFTASA